MGRMVPGFGRWFLFRAKAGKVTRPADIELTWSEYQVWS